MTLAWSYECSFLAICTTLVLLANLLVLLRSSSAPDNSARFICKDINLSHSEEASHVASRRVFHKYPEHDATGPWQSCQRIVARLHRGIKSGNDARHRSSIRHYVVKLRLDPFLSCVHTQLECVETISRLRAKKGPDCLSFDSKPSWKSRNEKLYYLINVFPSFFSFLQVRDARDTGSNSLLLLFGIARGKHGSEWMCIRRSFLDSFMRPPKRRGEKKMRRNKNPKRNASMKSPENRKGLCSGTKADDPSAQ